jgi:hypothetical protein
MFNVRLPVTGIAELEVKAGSRREALVKALSTAAKSDISQFRFQQRMTHNKKFIGMLNSAEVKWCAL